MKSHVEDPKGFQNPSGLVFLADFGDPLRRLIDKYRCYSGHTQ